MQTLALCLNYALAEPLFGGMLIAIILKFCIFGSIINVVAIQRRNWRMLIGGLGGWTMAATFVSFGSHPGRYGHEMELVVMTISAVMILSSCWLHKRHEGTTKMAM